jgi:toxin-antitoxin system PIN domain toxin
MRCVDVNILVYAHRVESPANTEYRAWLDEARQGDETLGVPSMVMSGFLRVVTHPRIFREPTPLIAAMDFADGLRSSPAVRLVEPGPRHWDTFVSTCTRVAATGNLIPDAYLAALCIELGATWISADRGFARFPGLRFTHPLDAAERPNIAATEDEEPS